jgi:uncharacterized protein YndB with AHSA1/START domain
MSEGEYGVLTGPGILRIERVLPGPIERVWAYLTESEKRGKWLATGETELRAGGRVDFHFRHADLTPHAETIPEKYKQMENGASFSGTVTRCEPPRLLSYTWGWPEGDGSEVTFELTPRGDEVLLTVTHRRVKDAKAVLGYASGWHTHLDILAAVLDGRVPPPFWATHEKLEAEYQRRLAP